MKLVMPVKLLDQIQNGECSASGANFKHHRSISL